MPAEYSMPPGVVRYVIGVSEVVVRVVVWVVVGIVVVGVVDV